jgi:hypothetical protein
VQRQICACQRELLQGLMGRAAPLQYAPVLQLSARDQLFVVARRKRRVAAVASVSVTEGAWSKVCDTAGVHRPTYKVQLFMTAGKFTIQLEYLDATTPSERAFCVALLRV